MYNTHSTKSMLPFKQKPSHFLILISIIYLFLGIYTLNNCYFWDTIQLISKEGFWYYTTNFSSLFTPKENPYGLIATGVHPPLIGITTALLWKIFGCKLWVSHVLCMFWAILLIYNTWKLLSLFFQPKRIGWTALIILTEPVVLTQYAIASPDFILFTSLIIALRGIFEHKIWLKTIGIFFLCFISMRGAFTGIALFFANYYYNWISSDNKSILKTFKITLSGYTPTVFLLILYFIYFLFKQGLFFTDPSYSYSEHYILPNSIHFIIKHLFSYGFRLLENGHFIIWLLALSMVNFLMKKKEHLTAEERMLGIFFLLLFGLYFLFVFISQMPFGKRYFMPMFFALTIIVLSYSQRRYKTKQLKYIWTAILFFIWTGNLWIYPDKMSKPWDSTLAHLPYYSLRNECFNFIDENGIDYNDITAGFCLNGDRGFAELQNQGKIVNSHLLTKKYTIYSNISNWEDQYIDIIKDTTQWTPLKTFKQWPVEITIYQQTKKNYE